MGVDALQSNRITKKLLYLTYEEAQIQKDDPFVFVSAPRFKLIIHTYIRLAITKMI